MDMAIDIFFCPDNNWHGSGYLHGVFAIVHIR